MILSPRNNNFLNIESTKLNASRLNIKPFDDSPDEFDILVNRPKLAKLNIRNFKSFVFGRDKRRKTLEVKKKFEDPKISKCLKEISTNCEENKENQIVNIESISESKLPRKIPSFDKCVDIDKSNVNTDQFDHSIVDQDVNRKRKIIQKDCIAGPKSSSTPIVRRSSRQKPVINYSEFPLNRKLDKMSVYEYNSLAATDTMSNGGNSKYLNGRNHNSVNDTYYNNSNGSDSISSRQQLNESASSMASLCNIGNSCYMNSVIYTLRFTPIFIHNLHHLVSDFTSIFNRKENQLKMKSASLGRNVNGLPGPNARSYSSKDLVSLSSAGSSSTLQSPAIDISKSTKHKAAEKLHELFQCLCNNELNEINEPHQADIFLKAVQDVNPIFEGNQQQDAHEFLMCILDSIRESCQTLINIITEHPDIISNG